MTLCEIINCCNQGGMMYLSLQQKLAKHLSNFNVERVRDYMSVLGKTKRGFDDLDPNVKGKAVALLELNGYLPTKGYRTMDFHIVKVK